MTYIKITYPEPTEDLVIRRVYPFQIHVINHGTKKKSIRHFSTEKSAVEWFHRAKEITALDLPKGVTLELRSIDKPFLARRTVNRKRIHKYFATLQDATIWLASSSAAT